MDDVLDLIQKQLLETIRNNKIVQKDGMDLWMICVCFRKKMEENKKEQRQRKSCSHISTRVIYFYLTTSLCHWLNFHLLSASALSFIQ